MALASKQSSKKVKLALIGTATCALAALALGASAWAMNPTYGQPPRAGNYKITGPSPGSLTVKQKGQNYFVENFRETVSRPDGECGQYQGQTAKILGGPIKLRRHVAHRSAENEVTYSVHAFKHFRRLQHGNVKVSIGGHTVVGNLILIFFRGIPQFKPIEGNLELAGVEGAPYDVPTCLTIFNGHRG
jgi:hypothetical protein